MMDPFCLSFRTVVVQGKERNVLAAKATLQKRLQKQAEFRMTIPAAHYRTIIGPKVKAT